MLWHQKIILFFYLQSLSARSFRCYDLFSHTFTDPVVILLGPNGSGKTSLLEALSLLAPGRGMRSTPSSFLKKQHSDIPWHILFSIETDTGPLILETYETNGMRKISVNRTPLKSHILAHQWLSVLWPPDYWEDKSAHKRAYLNRLVFTLFPSYGELLLKYEKVLRQRSLLLCQNETNQMWYESLEQTLANLGVDIFHQRNQALSAIQEEIYKAETPFPQPALNLEGLLESTFPENNDAQWYAKMLAHKRSQDQIKKSTSFGIHKTQFFITHPNGRNASLCSTGEQKGLLLSIVLAVKRLLIKKHPEKIHILLLDEVMARLDFQRQSWLWQEIAKPQHNTFVWITGLPDLKTPIKPSLCLDL
jgi:DNA replication and repair protein RecF